jgi:hypothetical protein
MTSLLKYPYPFKAALSVNNDTDGMNYGAFRDWHDFVNGTGETQYGPGLGLEIADSFFFWCWTLGGAGELALYHHLPYEPLVKSRQHDEILELARAGWLDTLHGFGDWREPDLLLDRDIMKRALDYLAEHDVVLRNYVNHGGLNMSHSMGGIWGYYQHGDDPGHQSYCLDLVLDAGFRYFWTDVMFESQKFGDGSTWRSPAVRQARKQAYNARRFISLHSNGGRKDVKAATRAFHVKKEQDLVEAVFDNTFLPVTMRDGNRVLGFKRYRGDYQPNTASFADQVNAPRLDELVEREAVVIVYQHFGVWKPLAAPRKHGASARFSASPLLDENATWAFRFLAERQERGEIFITTTQRLLDYLRVRDHLRFRTTREGGTVRIVLGDVDCPVYGREPITAQTAQGLSFEVPGSPERVVVIDERGTEYPADRHEVGDRTVVALPWRRLEYPY